MKLKKEKDCNRIPSLPPVDYDMLARKVREKIEAMKYWPADTLGEQLMRTAYSVLFVGSYDGRSQMALDIRTACFQLMADLDAEAPTGFAEREFADKLKAIHEKYHKKAILGGKYR